MPTFDPEKFERRDVWLPPDVWAKIDRSAKRSHINLDTWLAYAIAYVEETRWREVLCFRSVELMLERHYAPYWEQGVRSEPDAEADGLPF